MTKKQLQSKISKILKENGKPCCYEDYDFLWHEIDRAVDLAFTVYVRSSLNGDDTWLQSEAYIPKLGKTIIWDYDFEEYDNVKDIVEQIERTNTEIKSFEDKIIYNEN